MKWFFIVPVILIALLGVLRFAEVITYWWPLFFGSYRTRLNQELERLIQQWNVPKYLAKRARKNILRNESVLHKWIQKSHHNPHLFTPEEFACMILEGTILSEIHETGSLAAIDCYRRYMDGLEEKSLAKDHAKASLYDASRFWERSCKSLAQYNDAEWERVLNRRDRRLS